MVEYAEQDVQTHAQVETRFQEPRNWCLSCDDCRASPKPPAVSRTLSSLKPRNNLRGVLHAAVLDQYAKRAPSNLQNFLIDQKV